RPEAPRREPPQGAARGDGAIATPSISAAGSDLLALRRLMAAVTPGRGLPAAPDSPREEFDAPWDARVRRTARLRTRCAHGSEAGCSLPWLRRPRRAGRRDGTGRTPFRCSVAHSCS